MSMSRYRSIALVALWSMGVAASAGAAEGEFRQHYAAWQAGGIPAESNPRSPSDRPPRPAPARPPANRQVAPANWQEAAPPQAEQPYYDPGYMDGGEMYGAGSCGPAGCGTCGFGGCGFGGCGGCCDPCGAPACGCNTMVWARFEALLWWQEGRNLPPLVTTDPATEPFATAGILPDATILFGGGTEEGDMSAGGRFDICTWFDPSQCYGIGWRFFGIGSDGLGFRSTSVDNPVLAIPFETLNPVANDALVISYPGLREGEINFTANSEILGNDVYGRFLLCRGGICRIDFITGYHFSRVNDAILMRSRFTDVDPQSVDFGSVTTVVDQFAGANEFHGGILGFIWERDCGCWNTQLLARTALGGMRERMRINGSFTFDTLAAPPVTTPGGLFTAPTNLGTFEQTEFAAVTEFGATAAYRIGRCTQITLGYTFILWSSVQRPSEAIDPVIDLGNNPTRPAFNFNTTSYWVQGLNVGMEFKF
jgi:hypothetical protein